MCAFRYHGNYVGPGWSAGRYQRSVAYSTVPPVDEFDRTAQQHDRTYALKGNLKEADYKFYRANIGRGFKRSVAGLAVGIQGFLRKPQSFPENEKEMPAVRTPRRSRPRARSTSAYRTPRTMSATPRFTATPMRQPVFRSRSLSAPYGYTPAGPPRRGYQVMQPRAAPRRVARVTTANSFTGKIKRGSTKKTKRQSAEKKGVTYIYETGGVLDSATQSSLGHCNFAGYRILELVLGGLLHKMLQKLNHSYNSLDQVIGANFLAGDEFIIWGRNTEPAANGVIVNLAINPALTWKAAIDSMVTLYLSHVNVQNEEGVSPQFHYMEYRPANNIVLPAIHRYSRTLINIQDAKVHLYLKSDMKIQNRTVSVAADNEADDVNNVPLVGKTFDGSGTGALLNISASSGAAAADLRLLGQYQTGLIANMGSVLSTGGEPLQKKNFKYVKYEGSLKLAPGEIKTSTLVHEQGHSLDLILKDLIQFDANAVITMNRNRFGKFRFFQFDRMIDIGGLDNPSNITVAWEINLYGSAFIKLGRSSSVLPKYQRI